MIKHYFQSQFLRNIITLMTGAVIAQVIPLLASPLLTRIYTPEDFGIFALYAAITGILVVISSGRYELAIMLPKKEKDALALTVLSGFLTLVISLLSFILILIFKNQLVENIDSNLKYFIWIVPLGLLFNGMFQILNSLTNRKQLFKNTSFSKVTQSSATIGFQIILNVFKLSGIGLISGKVIGDLIAFIYLLIIHISRKTFKRVKDSLKNIRNNAITYKDFPRYQALSAFLNQLSQHMPAIILSFYYSPQIAGFYALTTRILSAPIRLIGISTREVFYQKASEMHANGESFFRLYIKTTLGLAKIGIIPFILFGVFASWIFVALFGEDWYSSGVYAQIIISWSFFLFINSPTTTSIYILNLQKFGLKFEIFSVIIRLLSLLSGYYFLNSHYFSIAFFAFSGVFLNLFLILYIYRKLKGNEK